MQPTCATIYTRDSIESSRLNDSKFYLHVLGVRLGWVQGHANGSSETKRGRPASLLKMGNYERASERVCSATLGKPAYDSEELFNSPAYWSGSQGIENRK